MSGVLLASGAAAALLASTLTASTVSAQEETVPPEKIQLSVNTVNGSGCPAGTAAVAVSPDNTAFTVTYSDYLAQVGVGASPTDFRKNCQLNLDVYVPQGFTYAIAKVDYRGYGYLEDGATGLQKASYYHQGSSDTGTTSRTFKGPFDNNWQASVSKEYGELVWAPCGVKRNFNINTELRVDGGDSDTKSTTSFMTMDSTDAAVSTVYHMAWKECGS
ncbi:MULTISPECIES: DUF4360 domain-containing protein [Streptomyces]|uniref:DUF4360 domain-containing protein n=1 Tax=Streptomyces TaxID=1883 RepID=UPI0002EE02E5|nr:MULTISPECIES: DUF4360 domain-containing protein [Streptomyces]MCC3650431.1 DUF4360 domain-containing protein [Streptomyces sp. S07_1.15]MZE76412.1 DUF4360 domain-containing protein [Streptomyces sp. SID5475]WSQ74589.1 DUF4360 domain-containing protein [Streptomyces xinghaiensis]